MTLHPKICNLCGGDVEYISNEKIYGKKYGSGYCYHCKKCGAYVGTHKSRPKEAFGILANSEMRQMKMKCHDVFDALWKTPKERKRLYKRLAECMNIKVKDCHFGYFDMTQLQEGGSGYGACGYGSMCDWCSDNTYGRPCVRALNEYLRNMDKKIDYEKASFEDVWNGRF